MNMIINTLMAERPESKTLAACLIGDIFRFGGNKMRAIGLKLDMGYVLLQSSTGIDAFEYAHPDANKNNFPVLVIGSIKELIIAEEG